ncbi:hypothetical protein NLU13_1288 [Sarocladium strictum]|uniref:Uncharacterized protein n=1 Tax=Sarocladium strictum TaxID=5046 RepID=A0AA39LCC0_SARSR|nr:hypothetical protein NLU13_1288 [Sarocladium strictum]
MGNVISINQDDDKRKGSARDGSDGEGTLSAANGNKSSSLSKLGATFIPISIYVVVCLLIFITLRRKLKRVYAPRTFRSLRAPQIPSPELPDGWFNWIVPFFRTPDTFVLNHGSLDGFFFLRYLRVLRNISIAGMIITWPILFPINATGGGGYSQLEAISLSNVVGTNRLFAHAVVAWVFFGFVLFTIVRESIYFVNLRQAYLSSPYYADRLSSRTVLLTSVPKKYLDEGRLRRLYGSSVRRIWIPKTSKDLANAVKEREQTAERLEKAEIALIKKANVARLKDARRRETSKSKQHSSTEAIAPEKDKRALEDAETEISGRGQSPVLELELPILPLSPSFSDSGSSARSAPSSPLHSNAQEDEMPGDIEDTTYQHPYGYSSTLPDVRGSVAAQWIGAEQRPTHRPLGNFGRKVDTIRWTRNRLQELNKQIYKMRRAIKRDDDQKIPAAFIEFDTQESAQAAHQVLAHHRPLQMSPRHIGIRPDEVVWSTLYIPWWQRGIRRFAMLSLIAAAIVFWSIPSAFVGMLSSIDFLAQTFTFLEFILKLPKPILGFIQGFLPALMLSLFMSLVPSMLRVCARTAGVVSQCKVELFTQTAYFGFQVVQVFLVTTLTSAASSAIVGVLQQPMTAPNVLAKSMPQASNFYISYILIQCLANGGTAIVHPFDLLRHLIIPKISDLPRTHYRVWRGLVRPYWGREFPVFSNMGVIAIAYSCLAPLVLLFSAGGMAFMHTVWKYNLLYVCDSDLDSRGLFYPRALLHILVGLYITVVCMVGVFGLKTAYGPMALMVLFLVVTGLVHISLNEALSPHLTSLPQTLTLEEQIQEEERAKREREEADRVDGRAEEEGAAAAYYDLDEDFGEDEGYETPPSEDDEDDHQVTGTRAVEGSSSVKATITAFVTDRFRSSAKETADSTGFTKWFNDIKIWSGMDPHASAPSAFAKWLHPETYEDFIALRKMLPHEDHLPDIVYCEEDRRFRDYLPPEMTAPKPTIWIPEDEGRVSRQEVAHTRKLASISDVGARLDNQGRVIIDLNKAPYKEPNILL